MSAYQQEKSGAKPNPSLIALLAVQIMIGYEWLISGIAKFTAGDFASGLSNELASKAADTASWYAAFLNSIVIPNGRAFGFLIETAEVLAGIVLILGPLLWIFAWDHVSNPLRSTTLLLMIIAAFGGVFMALNFHIANAGNHPWVLPDSGFDEGIDVDLLLSGIQMTILAVQIFAFNNIRRESKNAVATRSQVVHST